MAVLFLWAAPYVGRVLMGKGKSNTKDKNGNWFARHKVLSVIIAIIVLIIFVNAVSGGDDGTNNESSQQTSNEEKPTDDNPPKSDKTKEVAKVPAEYGSALAQADTYANDMHLSKKGLHDQLTSEYGGQFTKKAADYAVKNVEANWNKNALAQAKTYQNDMHLSPAAVHDQLTSEYGGQFTEKQADYAIKHLND